MKIDRFGRVSQQRIESLEAQYDIRLPKEYAALLMETNGGLIRPDGSETVTLKPINESVQLEILFGLGVSENCFNLDYWMNEYGDELPEGSLIIGNDILKGFIVILCRQDGAPVVYWDDERNLAVSSDEENAFMIADSFQGFLQMVNGVELLQKEDNMKPETDYLPLGSIVFLKGGVQKMLIISRALNVRNGDKTFFFDYGAVPYPEGLVSDKMAYFNKESVGRVVFEGYTDADDANMVDNIRAYLAANPGIVRGDPQNWAK